MRTGPTLRPLTLRRLLRAGNGNGNGNGARALRHAVTSQRATSFGTATEGSGHVTIAERDG